MDQGAEGGRMNRRPSMFQQPAPSPWYVTKTKCTECGKSRAAGSHAKCSRARQMRFAGENKA